MRRSLVIHVLAALVAGHLAACRGDDPVVAKRATPRPTARTTPIPSTNPAGRPVVASPAPVAGGKLLPPAGAFREVVGTVQLEAAYAVGRGAATLLSNNGGGVLRLGEAGLISDQGGNSIANNGGSIISDNGGGIISDNGGGIISDNGGGLIANNGGGLGAPSRWGLLAAGDETTTPEFGTVLPAAGLAVAVVELASGTLLPLGQDAAGNPAEVVVTDAAGGFRVWLPERDAGGVRVVGVPRTGADPRLRSALLASELGARIQLDEDSQRVASDTRQIMASNFFRAMSIAPEDVEATTALFVGLLGAEETAEINAGGAKLIAAYRASGVPDMDRERRLAIADRMADVVVAHVPLEAIRSLAPSQVTSLGFQPAAPGEVGRPALEEFGEVMAKVRRNVAKVMAAEQRAGRDPEAYFAAKPYLKEATERDGVDYAIRKPADFGDFLMRGVQANPALSSFEAPLRFAQILADEDLGIKTEDARQLVRAQVGISVTLTRRTYTGPDQVLPKVIAAMERAAR